MLRCPPRFFRHSLLLASLTFCSVSVAFAEDPEPRPLAERFPSGAFACLEAEGLGPVARQLQESALLERILASPQYQQYRKTDQYQQQQAGRQILEAQLRTDLWTLFEKVLGGRWIAALYPGDQPQQPHLAVLIEATDAELLALIQERIDPFLDLAGDRVERFETPAGTPGFALDGKLYVVIAGETVFAASTRDLLEQLQSGSDPESDPSAASLATDERFVAMADQLGDGHELRLFVDSHAIGAATDGRMGIPEKLDNPLASLLFSGLLELVAHSPYAGVTVDVEENGFAVAASVAGAAHELDESHHVFFPSPGDAGAPAIPQVEGLIGGFAWYRNLDQWYRQRETYLQPEALPGFDQFETNIGNLLPGRDIGEDVLPLLGDRMTFLAALQNFDHLEGEPGLKLPGFAAVIELADPEEGADTLRLFFQTLTAVLNLQASAQGREPWIMDSESYGGAHISYGRYLSTPEGDSLPVVFNFQPASALVGNQFLLCSSVDLCRELIDAAQTPADATAGSSRCFDLELHAATLADAFEKNRTVLEARAIQDGTEPERASEDVAALLELIRMMQGLQLTTSAGEGTYELRLQGSWK
ncbi:MAG: hypothetical protein DWQ34_16825 [Planctomycetota bacterium]|nr:MAG: hypothetical protein DWQ34_16825 [Planctomycetota bacterium]REK21023.1 MAG: hypothetical protein DWQ41_22760 [Planctomycetota bacterium]REK38841.1 MAG: hypothetical protein DWQ45_03055 [Planctomycetota bacterium]